MLQIKLGEKRRELVRQSDVDELVDTFAGLVLIKLGGWPARVAGGPKPSFSSYAPKLATPARR